MERKNWLILFAVCLLVAPITFVLGRWSQSAARPDSNAEQTRFASESRSSEETQRTSEAPDLSRVTIENLGEVEFDQVFELLHSAPKETLLSWTRRLEDLPVAPRKNVAIAVFFKTLAQIDTRTAVELALSMDRADPRWTAIGAVAVAAPAANLSEVARMYTALDERKQPIVGDLIANWSATDPEATARFMASYPGKVENGDIASFIFNWAALDPAAATAWLASADANRRDPVVYVGFYSGWMLIDRAAALTDLAARSADQTFEKAVKSVAEDLFKDSTEAARAFILTLPSGATQEAAVKQIAGHITGFYFGGDYLHLKPDEVTKWLLTLPENLWHEEIGGVIDSWAGSDDKPAFDAWYNQMPPKMRDRLLADQCRAFNWNIPTTGLQAGLRISDPELRQNTFREIFKKMDEEGKEELLQKAELSSEEAGELRRILKHL
jgi:hypothetical protein